jgi:ubiquinone/menaquinone biosynthesis C-methylase UbiE
MTDTDHQHEHKHRRGHGTGPMHDPEQYTRISARLAARFYRKVARDVSALGLPAGARVLDVGTGPGALPRRIAADAPHLQVDAVDVAPEMIAWAQQTPIPGLTFSVAAAEALPFPDATFDLVVSTLSQHHWADPAAGLREIRRVLRPGGRAWVYDLRWALSGAETAAATLGPGTTTSLERRLARIWWFAPVGRLVLRPE